MDVNIQQYNQDETQQHNRSVYSKSIIDGIDAYTINMTCNVISVECNMYIGIFQDFLFAFG